MGWEFNQTCCVNLLICSAHINYRLPLTWVFFFFVRYRGGRGALQDGLLWSLWTAALLRSWHAPLAFQISHNPQAHRKQGKHRGRTGRAARPRHAQPLRYSQASLPYYQPGRCTTLWFCRYTWGHHFRESSAASPGPPPEEKSSHFP